MIKAVRKAGCLQDTVVVAPHFSIDIDALLRPDREAYWDASNHWKRGNLSSRDRKQRISSFAAIDEIAAALSDRKRFPNVRRIVIAGHSAGGQFVQRYTAGRPPQEWERRLPIRYVIANPGRYFYFNDLRPAPAFDGTFRRPPRRRPARSPCRPAG